MSSSQPGVSYHLEGESFSSPDPGGKVPAVNSGPRPEDPGVSGGEPPPLKPSRRDSLWIQVPWVLLLLIFFLEGITCMGTGFKALGKPFAMNLMAATSNPIVALMIGVLATSVIQSSSTTTSIVVGMVASGTLSVPLAIPIVMGANIGTTITNLLVALGSIGRKEEFRRCFAAATVHDYFNLSAVAILLPLELATGYLQHLSGWVAGLLGAGGAHAHKIHGPVELLLKPPAKALVHGLEGMGLSPQLSGVLAAVLGILLVAFALVYLVKSLRRVMLTRLEGFFSAFLGKNWAQAMLVGLIVTVLVQSSSITTSLLVPMAGAGLLTLEQVYPVTLGANVGTTVTALLASLAAPAGLQIALVHLFFNISGILLLFPLPPVRRATLWLARSFAEIAAEKKRWAIIYVLIVFFGVPGLLLLLEEALG